MYRTQFPGYDGGVAQTSFYMDQTGQGSVLGEDYFNRPVRKVNMVDDANFEPFGDPDVPIGVRQQRLLQVLSGGKDEMEVSRLREFAKMNQQTQPQLLNPNRPGDIDQLGDILNVQPITNPNYINQHEQRSMDQMMAWTKAENDKKELYDRGFPKLKNQLNITDASVKVVNDGQAHVNLYGQNTGRFDFTKVAPQFDITADLPILHPQSKWYNPWGGYDASLHIEELPVSKRDFIRNGLNDAGLKVDKVRLVGKHKATIMINE